MEIIKEVIKQLGNLGVFGLAMWFIQMLLSKSADRKFESYKTELDQKTKEFQFLLDSKLESYKIELNLQSYKATKVYEQQLNMIIELHRKLTNLNKEMTLLSLLLMKNLTEKTNETGKAEIEQVAKAITIYDDFVLFYQNNLIFIPQNTVDQINNIIGEYNHNFMSYITQRGTKNEITFEQAYESAKKITTEIKQALDLLTFEFKKQLGVEK